MQEFLSGASGGFEVYALDRIEFAEAYLVAQAESTGVLNIVSFDKSIDRVSTVERIQPPQLPETAGPPSP